MAAVVVGAIAGAAALLTVRTGPIMSADSITYLSAAEHLRRLDGSIDFTGEPLAHFPPVFPLLLAPGGRSLGWAVVVATAAAIAVGVLFHRLLARRVRAVLAFWGALVLVLSQAVLHVGSHVWSEMPALALALATMLVATRPTPTGRSAAVAGVLAGLAFLTRYSAAGIVVTGFAAVACCSAESGVGHARRRMLRLLAAYSVAPVALCAAWVLRNMLRTGEPLGPHFEGGAGESPIVLIGHVERSLGRLITGFGSDASWATPVGVVLLAGLAAVSVVVAVRRPLQAIDVAMVVFAWTSIVLPTMSRAVAGTDLTARLVWPTIVPITYFLVVAVAGVDLPRLLLPLVAVVVAVSVWLGVSTIVAGPDRRESSADRATDEVVALYASLSALPDDAIVLTNSPHRVWWHTDRVPVHFAFTEPRPGNSHFPLSANDTVALACTGRARLAWFPGLLNAGGRSPDEVRPDLAARVTLERVLDAPGGTIDELVVEPSDCER